MTQLITLSEIRPPRLANVPDAGWRTAQQVAFRFTRRVRHDIGNILGSMELMRMMETMGGDDDPELAQARAEIGWGENADQEGARRLFRMAEDLSWLSQAANPAAFDPARPRRLDQLAGSAIVNRLSDSDASADTCRGQTCRDIWVVELGEMLRVAFGVLAFDWSPADGREAGPAIPCCHRDGRNVEVRFTGVSEPCRSGDRCLPLEARLRCEEQANSRSARDMALCLARHIIAVHGGDMRFDEVARETIVTLRSTSG